MPCFESRFYLVSEASDLVQHWQAMVVKLVLLLSIVSADAGPKRRHRKHNDIQLVSDDEFRSSLGITNLDAPTFFDATQHMDVILAYIHQKCNVARNLVLVDAFGGAGHLQHAFTSVGYLASGFDASHGLHENILTRRGFFHALDLILALMVGGLLFGGPPCSLFVYLSYAVHRRSRQNPYGNTSNFVVRAANMIVQNWIVLLVICHVRGCYDITEQPSTTAMFEYPLFALRRKCAGSEQVQTYMKAWAHDLLKRTLLDGCFPLLSRFRRFYIKATQEFTTTKVTVRKAVGFSSFPKLEKTRVLKLKTYYKNEYDKKTKKSKVSGFSDLGLTSIYTPEFCRYVLTVFEECIATVDLPNVTDVRISDYIRGFNNIGVHCGLDESSIMHLACNFNLQAFLKGELVQTKIDQFFDRARTDMGRLHATFDPYMDVGMAVGAQRG